MGSKVLILQVVEKVPELGDADASLAGHTFARKTQSPTQASSADPPITSLSF